jgi:acyl-CoA reductase-like NAD-dependent aldehyde dehydrogenase
VIFAKHHGCLPETHGFFHVFPQPPGAFPHGIQDSTLMTEEIFGPVLPVLTVSSCDEAISIVNGKEMLAER